MGIAAGIDGDRVSFIGTRTADISRIHNLRTRWIELQYERIRRPTGVLALSGGGNREIRGGRDTGHIHAAFNIDSDRVSLIGARTAKIRGIDEQRIDNERLRLVILANIEFHVISENDVRHIDSFLDAVDGLIRVGLPFEDRVTISCKDEVARGVERSCADAREGDPDFFWIGSRIDDEIVFEKLTIAVVDNIDSGINIGISNPLVSRYVGCLSMSGQVICRSRKAVHTFHLGMPVLA